MQHKLRLQDERSSCVASYCLYRQRLSRLGAIAALLCLICCQPSAAQLQAQVSDNISGNVVNSVTHEPIGRALVYTSDERYATFTDDHGYFELTLPGQASPPGMQGLGRPQAVLQAKKPGFLSEFGKPNLVTAGQKDVVQFLVPEALIAGHVKFPSAETADHVQVRLFHREVRDGFAQWTPLTNVPTRADGEFRFAGLAAGEYKVFTVETMEQDPVANLANGQTFGFPPRFFATARDFATADVIRVGAGETFIANVAPERQRYYEVKVPVIGAGPGEAPGIGVSVFVQGHYGPGFELGFDRSQNAIAGLLPNGNYSIEATSFGPATATGMTNITVYNGAANGPPVSLTANASIEVNVRQDFSGAADNTQAQRQTGGRHQPAAFVTLQSAEEFSDDHGPGTRYQSQGEPLRLPAVKPGHYWVKVQPLSPGGYTAPVTSGGKDLSHSPLTVPFGASVPPIEVTLRYDTGEIEATIEGNPAAYAVTLATAGSSTSNSGNSFFNSQWTVWCVPLNEADVSRPLGMRPDGRWILQQVPPGDYRILAFDAPQQLEFRNPVAMRAYESKGETVHVTAGQKATVIVPLIKSE
jgi:hypothetical protein